ncbi:GlxA family transcriptional regulator [Enterovibrio norvegicus]|uniref:Transcriptional regulator GlxA family, contains an amidase domain and an AraC-type DNA-binding HTH domain n=2 Tax=Enterovibrio norvegicus TaxID=188144 RepID=A0A1I5KYE4_9GAMM|nr:GlxA family transcriptional regulator [Enterovibrio norvegicus]MCC4800315.1 GlxA family transcriptional regulator [Enterovibrio norvegicus]SFO89501.1 Transcriptional regulator GlxA family, contains an amidase domain and an AraC-type DNA-binding HTH domain [Enterovibrio norvegicus DSM 15893]
MGSVSSLRQPVRIGFFLCQRFTMIAMASAIEVLRMANQLSGETLYRWYTFSEDGEPVSASDSLAINVDDKIPNSMDLDVVIVCGGIDVHENCSPKLLSWIAQQDRKHLKIGAICTGSYVLAKAGVMHDKACSVHWENLAGLQEAFPTVRISNKLFTISDTRMTSAGGTAPMDMMLTMVTREHGNKLSAAISEMFVCERVRNTEDVQKVPLRNLIGTAQPKLLETVSLMEANLEEPFCIDELAGLVELSRRQLERLFQRHLQCSPSRYYLHLRLSRARQLLTQTNLSVIEISIACGFVSTPHFSKCYRDYFGIPPREERLGLSQKTAQQQTKNKLFVADEENKEQIAI